MKALVVALALSTAYGSTAGPVGQLSPSGRTIRSVDLEPDGPLVGITESDLQKLIAAVPGQPYTPESVRATIRQLYGTGLFFDVQARVEIAAADQLDLALILQRSFRVAGLEFDGDVPMSRDLIRSRLPIRPGQRYDGRLLQEAIEAILGVYGEFGYYRPSVNVATDVDQKRASVRVRFRIEEGPRARISDIEFESEPPGLLDDLQPRGGALQRGRPFSPRATAEALEAIRRQLARRGYLRAEAYLADTTTIDETTGTARVRVRVLGREPTEITFTGDEVKAELIEELPLFVSTGPAAAFPSRSAQFLRRRLQDDGYLRASVTLQEELEPGQPGGSLTFDIDRGPKLQLASIDFAGNSALSDEQLRAAVDLSPRGAFTGGDLTEELLDQDVERLRRLYQGLGYPDTAVTPEFEVVGDDLHLAFQISEGAQVVVRRLTIEGAESISEDVVRAQMKLAPGQPYSPLTLAEDRADVIAYYEDRGYREVEMITSIERLDGNQIDISVEITENSRLEVADTLVIGNRETRQSIIEDRIALTPGEPFSQGAALRTEANLYDLAVFNRVRIRDIPKESNPRQRFVVIDVEEARQYLIQYGIGYSSFEGPRGTFGFSDNNLLGAARTLSLNLRAGARRQRGNLSLTFPRPLSLDLPTVLSLSVDNESSIKLDEQDRLSDFRGRPFDSLRYIASVQSEKTLSRRESIFYRYKFESVKLDVPPDLEDPLEFFRTEDIRLSSVSVTYLNDSREPTFDPRRGFFLNGEAQLTPRFLGSEAQFFRILTQGQYYLALSRKLTLATSLRAGAIVPFGEDSRLSPQTTVPIGERFFAGGASTLRGLPQDLAGPLLRDDSGNPVLVNRGSEENPDLGAVAEGGNALLIGNIELRYPILGILEGAVFYDVGNVYRSFTDLSGVDLSHSIGLSLGLRTPIGPLRVDAGYNPNPPSVPGFQHWTLHFNLGHPF